MAALLRRHRAARSVHFPKSLRPALAAFLARVPERIGVDESLAGLFNTHSGPFWDAQGPFLERYHAVLARRWPDLPPMPFADYAPAVTVDAPGEPLPLPHARLHLAVQGLAPGALPGPGAHGAGGRPGGGGAGHPGANGTSATSWPRTAPTTSAAAPAWWRPPPGCAGPGPPWATTPASATWPRPAPPPPSPSTAPPTRAAAPPGAPGPPACAWTASPARPASSPSAPWRAIPAWPASRPERAWKALADLVSPGQCD